MPFTKFVKENVGPVLGSPVFKPSKYIEKNIFKNLL